MNIVNPERSFLSQEVVRVQLLVLEACSFGSAQDIREVSLVAVNRLYILVGSYVVIDIIAKAPAR